MNKKNLIDKVMVSLTIISAGAAIVQIYYFFKDSLVYLVLFILPIVILSLILFTYRSFYRQYEKHKAAIDFFYSKYGRLISYRIHDIIEKDDLEIKITPEGDAEISQTLRLVSLIDNYHTRNHYIYGDYPVKKLEELRINIKEDNKYDISNLMEPIIDEPKFKQIAIKFYKVINKNERKLLNIRYYWPKMFNVESDYFTYTAFEYLTDLRIVIIFPQNYQVEFTRCYEMDPLGNSKIYKSQPVIENNKIIFQLYSPPPLHTYKIIWKAKKKLINTRNNR